MIEFFLYMQSFLNDVPWRDIAFLVGGGATGGGITKLIVDYWRHKRETNQQRNKVQDDLRDELRIEIDDLRQRLQKTEEELITWRKKHFELQEQYHEIKRENEKQKAKIEELREGIEIYKNS